MFSSDPTKSQAINSVVQVQTRPQRFLNLRLTRLSSSILNPVGGRVERREKKKLRVIQYSNKMGRDETRRDETYDKKKRKKKVGRDEEQIFKKNNADGERREFACLRGRMSI